MRVRVTPLPPELWVSAAYGFGGPVCKTVRVFDPCQFKSDGTHHNSEARLSNELAIQVSLHRFGAAFRSVA
jgi:hypothetical protein